MADRQRRVFIGAVRQRFIDKQMTWCTADHFQYLGVAQAFLVQPLNQAFTGTLGGHPDTAAQNIVLLTSHQRSPSSQPSRLAKALLKVRSSCSGVIETYPCITAWKSVPGPPSSASPAAAIQ
ncbi:hypothetical protein D3C73_1427750 [compost metagenome]